MLKESKLLIIFFFILSFCFIKSKAEAQCVSIDTLHSLYYKSIFAPLSLTLDYRKDLADPSIIGNYKIVPLVFRGDSLIHDSLKYEYGAIKRFAFKTQWTTQVYKWIFINPCDKRVATLAPENIQKEFERYAGKTINSIYINVLLPYGTSVLDTAACVKKLDLIQEGANFLHLSTSKRLIARELTFSPGQRLKPFVMVQNEINIRQLPFIDDVNLMVMLDPRDTNCVNVSVVCKDEFSWDANFESNFTNAWEIQVTNRNFATLGHQLSYEMKYQGTKDKQWGNYFRYYAPNVLGSHIGVEFQYQNTDYQKYLFFQAQRPFVSNQFHWAGGAKWGRYYYSRFLPDDFQRNLDTLFNYQTLDTWLGYSINMSSNRHYNRNIYFTARFYTTFFRNNLFIGENDHELYYDRYNILSAITFRAVKYYRTNLIYDFGRTEILPSGMLFSLIGGMERNNYRKMGYMGVNTTLAFFNERTNNYCYFSGGVGAHLYKKEIDRGVLTLGIGCISRLFNLSKYKYRFFSSANYINGFRQYATDYIYMDNWKWDGIGSDTLRGKERITLETGVTLFFPFIKKGFRGSLTTFANMGTLTDSDKSVIHGRSYWGIGTTLALRNDNLVFKNIAISLIYYPKPPSDVRTFRSVISGRNPNNFSDFRIGAPERISFK